MTKIIMMTPVMFVVEVVDETFSFFFGILLSIVATILRKRLFSGNWVMMTIVTDRQADEQADRRMDCLAFVRDTI